ncbi:hypothetical protein HDV02_004456, partial [Globomyces sp. JEL0801]
MKQEMTLFKNEPAITDSNASMNVISTHRKRGAEWEIYANLALRLNHIDDAKEGYTQCLNQKLSTSALLALAKIYSNEGNVIPCLQCVVKMVNCLDRTFNEETYPSLIKKNGLTKVQNALVAMNVHQTTYKHITCKSMNPDTVIEHLGFAPMQFIDQTIDITNKSLYKSMRYFETLIQDEMGVQQTEEGMQAIETLFEQAIDSKLDRFEGLNFNLSNQEQKQLNEGLDDLRLKMLIERYKKSKMLSIKEQLDKKIEQIQTVQKNLVRLENTAKENEIDPLKDSLISCKNELDEIQDKMEMIHKRTGSVDWGTVPVVGKAPQDSNRLKAVQTEIVGHLKKQSSLLNGQSPNISAWDVTREFRDALAI